MMKNPLFSLKYLFLSLSDLHWRHDLWSGVFQQWSPDVPPDDQNYPQGQQGTADGQQSGWSGEKSVALLVGMRLKPVSGGDVMAIGCGSHR